MGLRGSVRMRCGRQRRRMRWIMERTSRGCRSGWGMRILRRRGCTTSGEVGRRRVRHLRWNTDSWTRSPAPTLNLAGWPLTCGCRRSSCGSSTSVRRSLAEKAFQKMRAAFAEFETELRQWRINRERAQAGKRNRFMSRPPLGMRIHLIRTLKISPRYASVPFPRSHPPLVFMARLLRLYSPHIPIPSCLQEISRCEPHAF